ncbi:MAG: hypothetical protein Q9160_008441 [Pyrenula sp. 1 TL-2023]
MQCIAEMVCLWPIPGALIQYVKVFVDAEIGIVVGVVYCASMSITAFAFVGVEVVAACALEARPSTRTEHNNVNQTIKFSAVYLPFLAAAVYVLAGFLVTLDVSAKDSSLPQVSWGGGEAIQSSTDSAFVLAAQKSRIPALDDVVNVFILVTAISCANTNLFVATRTLFGLTKELEQGPGQRWYVNMLASFGTTNNRRVPMKAMLASCIFLWTPFLLFIKGDGPGIKVCMKKACQGSRL